jgi:hypothetical protein
VHQLAGKIISSLSRWLLITMMIMVILTRDLAFPRVPANDDQPDGPCVDDRLLHRAAVGNRGGAGCWPPVSFGPC